MIELLKILLSLSLSGTLLILTLLLCKPLYKNRFSKQWQYYIWLVVVARLLLPFTPGTSLIGNLFQSTEHITNETTARSFSSSPNSVKYETFPESQSDITASESSIKPQKGLVQKVFETVTQNIWLICGFLWIIVAVGLLIRKVTIYQSFVTYIKAGCIQVSDLRRWEHLGKLIEQTKIKRTIALATNNLISSPLLIGFFHPTIVLPSLELSDTDFENTILHELTHYKRQDMFYKWLVQLTICFHWFNPFVFWMGKEINQACEFSCDEAIIKKFDQQARQTYGNTLLHAINPDGQYKDSLACVTLNENIKILKER